MPKGKKLSVKQKKFVKAYAENGGNATEAALDTYDVKSREVAKSLGYENLQKPNIANEVEKALLANGQDMDSIIGTLREATLSGLGEKASNADTLKGVDMLLKLANAYPEQKTSSAHYRMSVKADLGKLTYQQLVDRHQTQVKEIAEILSASD